MATIPYILSQGDLNELARQEANLVQQFRSDPDKKKAVLKQVDSLLAEVASKGIVLFNWECNPDGC